MSPGYVQLKAKDELQATDEYRLLSYPDGSWSALPKDLIGLKIGKWTTNGMMFRRKTCTRCSNTGRIPNAYEDDIQFCSCPIGKERSKDHELAHPTRQEPEDGDYSSFAGYGGWGHDE